MIDSLLSEENKMFRDAVRKFAEEKITPNVKTWEKAGKYPDEYYGYLAEMTEKQLTGQALPDVGGWGQILADVPRALWREMQKIFYYLPRAVLLLLVSLIPVVNFPVAFLWFGFNSWMMALQYVDYPSDNHRESFGELKQFLRSTRLSAMGFGLPVAVGAMIPLVNLVVVPAAVCGATAYYVREKQYLEDRKVGRVGGRQL